MTTQFTNLKHALGKVSIRIALLGLVAAATMAACSTTEGFGKDVKHLGGDIEGSAAKNK